MLAAIVAVLLAVCAPGIAGVHTRSRHRPIPGPCYTAFPSASSTTRGKSTFYNRQRSVQLVVCDGFGQRVGAHFNVTAGMACALLTAAIPEKYRHAALFIDGSCSGAQLAVHHDVETNVGAACGFAADLLGVPLKVAGKLAGLGCALAPSAGRWLANWAESRHERAIARDVIRRGRCIRFNRHRFTRWAAVRCASHDRGFGNLRKMAPSPSPPPPPAPQPPAQMWITLPGTVLSYSDVALLTAEDFLADTDAGYLWVLGTRSGEPVRIDYTDGVPPGTSIHVAGALLTDPIPGHPLGLAVMTLAVTFPQEGINPPHTVGYFSVFDAASGEHLTTSAPTDPEAVSGSLVGYLNGDVRVAGNDFATIDAAGNVAHVPFPGQGSSDTATGSFALSPPVAGRVLVGGYDQPPGGCPTVYVVDVATEKTLSQTSCLHDIDDRSYSNIYFDGSAFAMPNTPAFFLAANGQQLTGAGQLGPDSFTTGTGTAQFLKSGVRSDLTVVQNGGYSYFVSTANWGTVFTSTPEQVFTPYGVADDDVWVDTSHWEAEEYVGGRIVIDAHTGREVAPGWSVFPIAGGAGWTLTSTQDVCCEAEYLLRSSGTLLTSLSSAP